MIAEDARRSGFGGQWSTANTNLFGKAAWDMKKEGTTHTKPRIKIVQESSERPD